MSDVQFTVSVIGETTGEKWYGQFKTKTRLSHRDQFRRDQIRRDLLGPNPEGASPRAENAAEVFSEIALHLVEAPSWWKNADNGLSLEDDNVVAEVFNEIMKAKAEAQAALAKKAEDAKKALEGAEQK